jgi:hypothetical protein
MKCDRCERRDSDVSDPYLCRSCVREIQRESAKARYEINCRECEWSRQTRQRYPTPGSCMECGSLRTYLEDPAEGGAIDGGDR